MLFFLTFTENYQSKRMANNSTVSDKNMRRKRLANAIINHSGRYVSKKKIHERIEAVTKASNTALWRQKKKDISKAIHRRGAGCDLIGPGYLPDRDYNYPEFFAEGFIHTLIYKDDMRRMTRRDWDNFQHEGDDTEYDDEDNEWRHHISDIDPEEEASPRSPCSGCGADDDYGFSGDSCYSD